jgi:hypothetical protein
MPDWLLPRARQRQPVIRKVFSLAMIAFIPRAGNLVRFLPFVLTGPAMKVFPMTNALTAEYFFEKADQCFRRSRGDRKIAVELEARAMSSWPRRLNSIRNSRRPPEVHSLPQLAAPSLVWQLQFDRKACVVMPTSSFQRRQVPAHVQPNLVAKELQ